jgi:hypothetical protein
MRATAPLEKQSSPNRNSKLHPSPKMFILHSSAAHLQVYPLLVMGPVVAMHMRLTSTLECIDKETRERCHRTKRFLLISHLSSHV